MECLTLEFSGAVKGVSEGQQRNWKVGCLLQLKGMQMPSPIHLICSNLSPFHFSLTQKPGDNMGNSNGKMDRI